MRVCVIREQSIQNTLPAPLTQLSKPLSVNPLATLTHLRASQNACRE